MPAKKITKENHCQAEIESAMKLKRLSQEKLGKRLGVTQGAVSGYLKNIYAVTPAKILMMSDILGISIFDIMTKYWKEEKA